MPAEPFDAASHDSRPELAPEVPQEVWTSASDWLAAFRSRIDLVIALAIAETKLAASTLAVIMSLAVVTAVLLLTAWGLIMAGVVLGMHHSGLPLWAALLLAATFHVVLAVCVFQWASTLHRNLGYSATRAQLHRRDTENVG